MMKGEDHLLYRGRKALVLGLGRSGQAVSLFLIERGALVWGIEENLDNFLPELNFVSLQRKGLKLCSKLDEKLVEGFDLFVPSPGVPRSHPIYKAAKRAKIEISGEVELALREKEGPVFGITGTNGKTTVTRMLTHILNKEGIKAQALGNIGVSVAGEVRKLERDVMILELSSYQLETLKSKVLDTALILNISPDHLDRYDSFEDYAKTKIAIKDCLKEGGKLYVKQALYEDFYPFFEEYVPEILDESLKDFFSSHKIFPHDLENIVAALTLAKEMGVKEENFRDVLKGFEKLPHRLEFVEEINGVSYYNDSKATNLDAVIKAVEAIRRPVVLIAGGVDKGGDYRCWIKPFSKKVKFFCLMGEAREKIAAELGVECPVKIFGGLKEAFSYAVRVAGKNECVLFSPGCSSFDQFKNFEERGEVFKSMVYDLSKKEGVML